MKQEQIDMVKHSWSLVAPIADTAATLFYDNLFEADPSLRKLFSSDMTKQKQTLMATLGYVVSKLDRLDDIVGDVMKLGAKHAGYGVQESHYGTVGASLIKTLEQGLGEHWNTEVKDSWIAAYSILSGAMILAQKEAEQKAAGQH